MKIGEFAKKVGTPVATVRYYEQEGLLPAAARLDNNYRHYGGAHIERLQFILRCRSLDMSLAEIRQLLDYKDGQESACAHTHALLDGHIAQVQARMAELQNLQMQLQLLRAQCSAESAAQLAACGILQQLDGA
jgi:Cd(II)/Pb(II)-responsive transcriptional regulator